MKSKIAILPFVDLVFLALGGVLACMSQMEIVNALPIEVAHVGKGAAVVQNDKFTVLTLTADGMRFDGEPITVDELSARAANKNIVLRADREIPTQNTMYVIALLAKSGAQVSVEVKETDPAALR